MIELADKLGDFILDMFTVVVDHLVALFTILVVVILGLGIVGLFLWSLWQVLT